MKLEDALDFGIELWECQKGVALSLKACQTLITLLRCADQEWQSREMAKEKI